MTAQLATRVRKARRESQCPVCRKWIRVGDQIAKCGTWMCIQCAITHRHDSAEEQTAPIPRPADSPRVADYGPWDD